jgi:hypothetical protein
MQCTLTIFFVQKFDRFPTIKSALDEMYFNHFFCSEIRSFSYYILLGKLKMAQQVL